MSGLLVAHFFYAWVDCLRCGVFFGLSLFVCVFALVFSEGRLYLGQGFVLGLVWLMDRSSLRSFWAHALPCVIMAFCMLWFTWLSISEPDMGLSVRYILFASVSFTLTFIGYWGYCRFYETKRPPSPFYAVFYTLFFAFYYLSSGLFRRKD